MKGNRLIVHALIETSGKYLVTKRSSLENVYPNYYDIPGGLVNFGELPQEAVIREVKEETNLDVIPISVIYEFSNYDNEKDMIFTTLVYKVKLLSNINDIRLDKNEHIEYKLINNLNDINDKYVPFLDKLI